MTTILSPTLTSSRATSKPAPTSIDLITPVEACRALDINAEQLLGLVNGAALAAYNLGGFIRFRETEVRSFAQASQLQSSASARRSPAA